MSADKKKSHISVSRVDIPIGYDDLEIVAVDIKDCTVLPLHVLAVYHLLFE